MSGGTIGVGLVGFGLAGAAFHAPLIRAIPRLDLRAVASSRRSEIEAAGLAQAASVDALLSDPDIALIVIASPNRTHHPIAMAALEAGKHVVVDKPLTASAAEADELIAAAGRNRRLLTVFHNRRWDGDFLTVKALLDSGRLGEPMLFEAHWDRFRPAIKHGWRETPGDGAGLLFDLGPHLIDQALLLFGRPDSVEADIERQRDGAEVDDYFRLTLHYGRMRAILAASTLVAEARPRFAVHGTGGSFVKYGLDPQEAALKLLSPLEPGFGRDPLHGSFTAPDGKAEPVETIPGRYLSFYEAVAAAILDDAPVPVDPIDARDGLRIVELARQSAREGRRLPFN